MKINIRKAAKGVYYTTVPLYEVLAFISFDADATNKYFELEDAYKGVAGAVEPIEQSSGAEGLLIYIKDADPNTIAHEAVHAAWRTLNIVGVEVEWENHEHLAYLVGWYVDAINQTKEKVGPRGTEVN